MPSFTPHSPNVWFPSESLGGDRRASLAAGIEYRRLGTSLITPNQFTGGHCGWRGLIAKEQNIMVIWWSSGSL